MSLPPRTSQGSSADSIVRAYERRGLSYQAEGLLREAIDPGHRANPWASKAQFRNCMTIRLLLGTGIRGGEFLNLRIRDFDLRQNSMIVRGARDNDDHRLYGWNVRHLPRRLRIKPPLAELVLEYIINERMEQSGAQRHDFLAVSSDDGSPLSQSAFNNIFASVRERVPGIPRNFAGKMCRSTWHDRFSDYCDLRGIDPAMERIIRCRIMGWRPGSRMAFYFNGSSPQREAVRRLGNQAGYSSGKLGGWFNELTTD